MKRRDFCEYIPLVCFVTKYRFINFFLQERRSLGRIILWVAYKALVKKVFHPKIRDFQGQIKSRKKWNLVIELFFPDSMRLFLHSEGFIMKMWQHLVSLEKKSKMEIYVRSQQMHCASGLRHLWVNTWMTTEDFWLFFYL